jgi:hypothetical protein
MRAALCVALVAFVAFAVAQPIRPHISETFEGEGYTHIVTSNETIWGLGRWVIDEPAGHALEFWEFAHEHRHHSVHVLKRYDLKFEYFITFHHHPHPHHQCHKRAVTPPMPPAWHWIREARYHGKHVIDGTTFDQWGHHFGGVDLEVAVGEHDASRPHYFTRRTPSEHRQYHLISWATFKPNVTWFHVPEVCKNATEDVFGVMPVQVDGDDSIIGTCGVAASHASRIVTESNGFGAASMIASAFNKAGITVNGDLAALAASGSSCTGGARLGDVFFDTESAAVYLGDNQFAECPTIAGASCAIVPPRDFTGGCRRFC